MKRDFAYIFTIIILVLGLVLVGARCRKSEPVTENKTDTLIIVKTDTLLKEVEKLIVKTDTVFVYADTTYDEPLEVPVVSKTYEDDDFRAVISGPSIGDLTPALESMIVYPKTETKYVVTEIEKEVECRRWELYIVGEIYSKKSTNFASLGVLATMPNGFLFGPKIGYSLGEPFIGGTLGYRITNRR